MTELTAQQYIDDVLSGKEVVCKWVRLAVEKHVADLERQNTEEFPYYFSAVQPSQVIAFCEKFCYHVKGEFARRKETVRLMPWQQFIVWVTFGWRKRDGNRKYNTVFIEVAKKNGKSTFIACLGLYLFCADKEPGAEVYSAATTRDQARIIFFDYARAMVLRSDELKKVIQVYKNTLTYEATMSTFRPVSADYDTLDGLNVHAALIDEYHAHKTDGVYNILSYGMAARKQPMQIIITTAGFDNTVPCVGEEQYTKDLSSGKKINESYCGIVYTLDEEDDWQDEDIWIKANPNLGTGKEFDSMKKDFVKARDREEEQNKFKNKHLNIWTSSQSAWIKDKDWEEVVNTFEVETAALCYAGVDLSTTIDASAYALCWPEDGLYKMRVKIYLPEDDIEEREKREGVPWRLWAKKGFVTLTYGNTIDYDYIQKDLLDDAEEYDLREIAYDPYNASQFITNLMKEGLEDVLTNFPQTWKYMSPAAKDFHSKILDKKLLVYHNDCLNWMVGATEVKTDINGNIHPVKTNKDKSRKHIDGVVACIMALDRAVRNTEGESVYNERGVIVV